MSSATPPYTALSLELDGPVAVVTLQRPERMNALSRVLLQEIGTVFRALAADPAVRAVVLTGSGEKAFCAGADLKERQGMTEDDVRALLGLYRESFGAVDACPKPVVAAIQGVALGGGFELALACDLRVASKSAKIGMPEVTLGIYPSAGGTWRLPRLVGLGRAKELIYTGRIVDASEAAGWGLFESLVETDAKREALRLARLIAANAPLAVQVAKVSLNAAAKVNAAPMEWVGQGLLFDSDEKRARMTAFLEQRKK